jgi:hypothetical protein
LPRLALQGRQGPMFARVSPDPLLGSSATPQAQFGNPCRGSLGLKWREVETWIDPTNSLQKRVRTTEMLAICRATNSDGARRLSDSEKVR